MKTVLLNGECLPEAEAAIPVNDRGFLYGESVFTTLRLYNGFPMALDRHCRRLNATLATPLFHGVSPLTSDLLWADIRRLRDSNEISDGVLRIRLSSGQGAGILPPAQKTPSRLLTLDPLPEITSVQQHGIRLWISSLCRPRENPLPRHKLGNYAENVYLKLESQAAGFHDGVFCDPAGHLLETSTSNLFAVINGILVTPDLEECILPGITRELILERARAIGIPILLGPITLNVAQQAEEMFTTNAVMEVVPVSAIGEKTFALVPGPVTLQLAEQYRQLANARRLAEQYTGTPAGELRTSQRHQVKEEIRVDNRSTGQPLGRLLNLSEEGLLLVGPEELPVPQDFSLRLNLPAKIHSEMFIDLNARCVRTLPVGTGLFGAGFRFLGSEDTTRNLIRHAIDSLCFQA